MGKCRVGAMVGCPYGTGVKSHLADVCLVVGFQWSVAKTNVQICFDTFYRTFSLLGFPIKIPLYCIVLSMHEHSSGFHLLCVAYKKGLFGGLFDVCC
jgi:hypothetical protein